MTETTIIENGLIFTSDPQDRIIRNGKIIIEGDRIVEASDGIPSGKYRRDNVIDAKNQAVLPGLVDTHFHSTTFHRGSVEEMMNEGMDKVLEEFFYPLLKWITPEDVYDEAMLAYIESVRSGITFVNDMYRHITACADAAERIGIRAAISSEAADLFQGQENLQDNENAFKAKNNIGNGRIKIWFGGEWVPVCSPEFYAKMRDLANKYKTGIHVHLNESLGEVELCKRQYGKRPIEHVYDLGLLGADSVAAHCVWLTDKEIRLIKESGANVATCPVSNMKLGNGIARTHDMLSAGLKVGIGTDAYQNNLDMFEAIKFAVCVQRGARSDAASRPSLKKAFRMATYEGAEVMGMQREIGSIEAGKKADIITVDLKHPRFIPTFYDGKYFNVLANLVFSAHGDNVRNVIIDGNTILRDGKVMTIDEEKALERAQKSAEKVMSKM